MDKEKPTSLLDNSRFYVLATTICLSLIIFFALRITIVDSRLRDIRLQQIFGLCAVTYWYILLLMAPISKIAGQRKWLPSVLFTRRALGVSVAYFGVLHFYLAITQQLQGWHGIWLLPRSFQLAVLSGFTTLVVLLVMAALSIDKLVKLIGFKQWKWLGRISYIAGLLIIVHVWIIGTHVEYLVLQLLVFQMLALLFGLEAWRYSLGLQKKGMKKVAATTLACFVWLVLVGGMLVMRAYVSSYGNEHAVHLEAGTEIHAH